MTKDKFIDGVIIRYYLTTKRVYWMSEWDKAWELVAKGRLSYKFYPKLYGHTEFYVEI